MKKRAVKITGIFLVLVMMVAMFAGCGETAERPKAVELKTELNDASFTLSYGQLRTVIPGDQLAALFENVNEKTDDKTISISYYELVSRFGKTDYFDDLVSLLNEDELKALTANGQQVLEYFNTLINDIKMNSGPAVTYNEEFKIHHGDEVNFKDKNGKLLENQDEFKAAFRIYADMALKNIGDYLMNSSEPTKPGDDLTDIIYPMGLADASKLTLSDLYAEEGGYPIYSSVIPTLAYDLDESGENAKDENGEFIFIPTELQRTIVMNVKPNLNSVEKAFSVREKSGIEEELKKAEAYMTVNSFDIGFKPCKITAGIDAVTDRMTSAVYEKNMVISADVTFSGSLAKYGDVIVEFPCTSTLTYKFGWQAE